MLMRSATPSIVPRVIASMLPVASDGTSFASVSPVVSPGTGGTISSATAIAAGVAMIDAIRMCASASGTVLARKVA